MTAGNNSFAKYSTLFREHLWGVVIVVYFMMILAFAQNIPMKDDYDSTLLALAHLYQYGSVNIFFFWPQNEHIIFPVRFFTWLVYVVTGKVNFLALILLGNLFLLGLYIANTRLVARVVVLSLPLRLVLALLIFNFSFWESSLWAMASLSNIVVLAFAAAAFACLGASPTGRNVALAALFTLLASISQANGVFVSIVCLFYLLVQGRHKALTWFVPVTAVCLAFFYHAHAALPIRTVVVGEPAYAFLHPLNALCYFLMFLGSVIPNADGALILGGVMLITWGVVLLRQAGSWRSAANALLIFLALTAVAVTLGRASLGMQGAYAPRYSMNSVLFLAILTGMAWPWLREAARWHWLCVGLALSANAATFYGAYPEIEQQISRNNALYDKTQACEPLHANYPDLAHADMVIHKVQRYGLFAFPVRTAPAICPIRVLPLVAPHQRTGSAQIEGYLDNIAVADKHVVLGGWWKVADTEWGSSMVIATPVAATKIVVDRVARPDLAQRFNNPAYLHSGFGVILEFADNAQAQAAAKQVCIAYESGFDFMTLYPLRKQPNACPQFLMSNAG